MVKALLSRVCAFMAAFLFGAMGAVPTQALSRGVAGACSAPHAEVGQPSSAAPGQKRPRGDHRKSAATAQSAPTVRNVRQTAEITEVTDSTAHEDVAALTVALLEGAENAAPLTTKAISVSQAPIFDRAAFDDISLSERVLPGFLGHGAPMTVAEMTPLAHWMTQKIQP
ncbi:MAG: hypothetical protein RL291_833 [Pseudomonadota bacterium]|jgi:hypothetical protein